MRPSEALERHREEIRKIVAAHGARNPWVFGSVARGTDTEDSDIDLIVEPLIEFSLFSLGALCHELTTLLGFPVDVVFLNEMPDDFFFV
jgi:uncharacterized protein